MDFRHWYDVMVVIVCSSGRLGRGALSSDLVAMEFV